jgi:four helix bundle protein
MRRAAVSIMANIVEGYSRESTKEYMRFLTISIGSATELKVFLEISLDLGYLDSGTHKKAEGLLTEVMKLLYSYRKTLRGKIKE